MNNPLRPHDSRKIGRNIDRIDKEADKAGQGAAGGIIRGSDLPFVDLPDGTKKATIPSGEGGTIGISFDPTTPPDTDFGFSVRDPDDQPKNVDGIPGMKDGEASVPPLQLGPAIKKAGGYLPAELHQALMTRSPVVGGDHPRGPSRFR